MSFSAAASSAMKAMDGSRLVMRVPTVSITR